MSPHRPATVLLVAVGLLLVANPLWLFPHEGDGRYTYERSRIVVDDGTLAYRGAEVLEFDDENNLDAVGCQPGDAGSERACALDRHLVDHAPITVPRTRLRSARAEFVRVDGEYYRRIHRPNRSGDDPTVTFDVERVAPRTVLAESARNLSGRSAPLPDDEPVEVRVAVTGDAVTSYERLDGEDLGNVYRLNGSYYTVVGTEERRVDHGLGFLQYEVPRIVLAIAGLVLLVGGVAGESR